MARPKKKDANKLTVFLPPVRCTPQEKTAILKRAKEQGMSYSDYARQYFLVGDVQPKSRQLSGNDNSPSIQLEDKIIYELHRVGNNLNQLTKRYHRDGKEPQGLQRLFPVLETLMTDIFKRINLNN